MIRFKKIDKQFVLSRLTGSEKLFEGYSDSVICIYLFGSINSKNTTPLSDIDIAVLFQNKLGKIEMIRLENEIFTLLSKYFKTDEIDLLILNNVPLSVQFGVIKEKSIIYYSDFEKMIDFENIVILDYLDIKPYRDEFNSIFIDSLI
jgi:uncharacterized protein